MCASDHGWRAKLGTELRAREWIRSPHEIEKESTELAHKALESHFQKLAVSKQKQEVSDASVILSHNQSQAQKYYPQSSENLLIRLVRTMGDVDIVHCVDIRHDPVSSARKALCKHGATVLVDSPMVRMGIQPLCRHYRDAKIICALPIPQTHDKQKLRDSYDETKGDIKVSHQSGQGGVLASFDHGVRSESLSAQGVAKYWPDHLEGAVVVIGNAPTALLRLLEGIAYEGWPLPASIFAAPVGFVGAAVTKDVLWRFLPIVPMVVLRGMRGGSAAVATMANAVIDSDSDVDTKANAETDIDIEIEAEAKAKAEAEADTETETKSHYSGLKGNKSRYSPVHSLELTRDLEVCDTQTSSTQIPSNQSISSKTTPWLSVIGMGLHSSDSGFYQDIWQHTLNHIGPHSVVVGSLPWIQVAKRYLPGINTETTHWVDWEKPFHQNRALLARLHKHYNKVLVLASGDPSHFGVARTVVSWFGADAVRVFPNVGIASWVAATLRWPLQDVDVISVHGRPLARIKSSLFPHARLIILLGHEDQLYDIAMMLVNCGLGDSRISLFVDVGIDESYAGDRSATADQWLERQNAREKLMSSGKHDTSACATIALEIPESIPLTAWSGVAIDENTLLHDGMISRSAVRAYNLFHLRPFRGAVLWDIGAGCGGMSVDWLRHGGRVVAFEHNRQRADYWQRNVDNCGFGQHARMVEQSAPAAVEQWLNSFAHKALHTLDEPRLPDAIFIGGGLSSPKMVETLWKHLRYRGILVANAVTPSSDSLLVDMSRRYGGTLYRMSYAHSNGIDQPWNPERSVLTWSVCKPS